MPRNTKPIKNNGSYIFSDFSEGLYLLDTPRSLGEQLASLALKGGRNIWSERGALVPQYGYIKREQIKGDRVLSVTQDAVNGSSFFLVTAGGVVYFYTANQGLKRYKTQFESVSGIPITTRRGNDLVIYNEGVASLFGGYYEDSTAVTIDSNVPVSDFGSHYEFRVPLESEQYYWNGKEILAGVDIALTITSTKTDDTGVVIQAVAKGEHKLIDNTVTLSEKTIKEFNLIYKPEDTAISTRTITPTVMGIAVNRLFIVDISGDIFYSQVGVIDSFEEKYGAGYFGGFYNDTSTTLSIEDYMSGALIAKKNGLYYATLETASNHSSVSANSRISLNVKKVAQIGQEYASDHVIVREKVFAYDSNSGALVNAVMQNVFGSPVAGKPLVPSEYLDAQFQGIADSKRFLTYNAEAQVFILYYGELLEKGMVITSKYGTMFPRELDRPMQYYLGFNQGVAGIADDGTIIQDFKKGTIIENVSCVAEFEAIGLRDNRFICSSILEVSELNGIEYTLQTANSGYSYQIIKPSSETVSDELTLPPLLYSDKKTKNIYPSFELETKWANKQASLTRIYAPMSGRDGVSLTFEFPKNQEFCLIGLRLPDFSQGE